ncbi:DUF2283 domain-containing protein [Candidatus Pacearchaeota archaeon]|nr:DUF2283 domain-containing protein [Candidatus Pacearchaeota archaeon]
MKITYDKDADAIYVQLSDKKFSKCKEIDRNTILDIDEEGNVIGIELLFVSKRFQKIPQNINIESLSAH